MVALKLREYRKINNMTQEEVAEKLKIARVTYSRYESGEHEMTYESLAILSTLYSVSIDSLLGRSSPEIFSKQEVCVIDKLRSLDERGRQSVLALMEHEHTCIKTKKAIKKPAR